MTRRPPLVVSALLLVAAVASCGGGGSDGTALTVFAASSLTDTFGELESRFEEEHPDVDVVVSYDSSATLAEQIAQGGAPADVLATADEQSMQILVDGDANTSDPEQFATNTMTIVTPPDNPAGIQSLDDLDGTDFVLCDPSAPCGDVARRILANAGVDAEPVSLEDKVTAVLSKVTLGEAEAGLVYVTDAQVAGDEVESIAIPDDVSESTPYLITPVEGSDEQDLAEEWVALVQSEEGQQVLSEAGFKAP